MSTTKKLSYFFTMCHVVALSWNLLGMRTTNENCCYVTPLDNKKWRNNLPEGVNTAPARLIIVQDGNSLCLYKEEKRIWPTGRFFA